MSVREAFMRAIIADPADDSPRLIFADWLDEQGEVEQAEFIRIGCRLSRLLQHKPSGTAVSVGRSPQHEWLEERDRLKRRERELLGECQMVSSNWHRWSGLGPLLWNLTYAYVPNRTPPVYRRGFISKVTCSAENWLAHGPAIVRAQPVERVALSDKRPGPLMSDDGGSPRRRFWAGGNGSDTDEDVIPESLFDRFLYPLGGYVFPTEQAALDALSAAALSWARSQPPVEALTHA